MRLTILCPDAHIADANHLAMVLGYSSADGGTYREPRWRDADGNLYAAASLEVSDDFVANATSALERPEWDGDSTVSMAAAKRAQARVTIWGLGEYEREPVATPDHILAMFNPDPLGVLARAGVTRIEPEPEI